MKPPPAPETPQEKYARKQRERVLEAALRSKKDRKRERARGFRRPPVSEEAARAAQARVHEREFPEDAPEYQEALERYELAKVVTDVAVRKSRKDAEAAMTGTDGRVALSRREATPSLEDMMVLAKEKAREEGAGL